MQVKFYMLNQLHKHVRPGQESPMMNCSKNQGTFICIQTELPNVIGLYFTFPVDILIVEATKFHSIMLRLACVNDHHSDTYPFHQTSKYIIL